VGGGVWGGGGPDKVRKRRRSNRNPVIQVRDLAKRGEERCVEQKREETEKNRTDWGKGGSIIERGERTLRCYGRKCEKGMEGKTRKTHKCGAKERLYFHRKIEGGGGR